MRRFRPEFEAAHERIQAGEIGSPMLIKSADARSGPAACLGARLENLQRHAAEVNSHDWDCVRWLMSSNPQRVYTEVANFKGAARGVDTPDFYDNVLVNIRFESSGLGSISGVCPCEIWLRRAGRDRWERGIMQIGEMQGQAVVVCTQPRPGLITPIYRTWPQRFAWGYIVRCNISFTAFRATRRRG